MNRLKRWKVALTVLLCSIAASAHDFGVNGIYYEITSSRNVAVTSKNFHFSNGYKGKVVIPESVTYYGKIYSVTSIGRDAFAGCSGLTSVIIPYSVTSIDEEAFYDCI